MHMHCPPAGVGPNGGAARGRKAQKERARSMFSGFLICALGNCFLMLAMGAMAARGFDEHDDPPSTGNTTTRGTTTSRPAGTTTTPPVRYAGAATL